MFQYDDDNWEDEWSWIEEFEEFEDEWNRIEEFEDELEAQEDYWERECYSKILPIEKTRIWFGYGENWRLRREGKSSIAKHRALRKARKETRSFERHREIGEANIYDLDIWLEEQARYMFSTISHFPWKEYYDILENETQRISAISLSRSSL